MHVIYTQVFTFLVSYLEFKDMWGKIAIPDETDLPRELEAGTFYFLCILPVEILHFDETLMASFI